MSDRLFRALTEQEVSMLKSFGCKSQDWSRVKVADGFDPNRLKNVEFSGDVTIGVLKGEFVRPGGVVRQSSISDATLHNVSIGDGAYIRSIANYIANYDIADNAYIENVDCLTGTLDSSFGIGTEVSVLNETGGREVAIYDTLSAQTAYVIAMYRHDAESVKKLGEMIRDRAASLKGTRGKAGKCCEITNCGTITNVNIGDYARIKGATRLLDGTIASSKEDPVFVGRDVIAEGFIFASGSHVADGAVVHHCFVGQASSLSHLFSAHDSLFFANCACENGEAAAIFGGPYTVTMHKSSLLIAGIYSFLNAGSGSNQSNHMYKLGPIHQGVVERGSKTTSDSYILWPARIGAFSLVMGRHVNHPDTSSLPFSYLIENHNESFLVPGINLRSVGTIRDAQKWPRRDKRKDSHKLDSINFNLLSPFTVGKMMRGIELLTSLENTAGATASRYSFQSMTIEARALRRGRKYYHMAIDKFMGNSIITRVGNATISSDEELRKLLAPTHQAGKGQWVDICGMFAPKTEVERVMQDFVSGKFTSLEHLEEEWKRIHADYYDMEWTWVADNFEGWWGKPIEAITCDDLRKIVEKWTESVSEIDDMLLEDARKEYSLGARTGFGIDDPAEASNDDFANVRGRFDEDSFVEMVKNHKIAKKALGESVVARIKG